MTYCPQQMAYLAYTNENLLLKTRVSRNSGLSWGKTLTSSPLFQAYVSFTPINCSSNQQLSSFGISYRGRVLGRRNRLGNRQTSDCFFLVGVCIGLEPMLSVIPQRGLYGKRLDSLTISAKCLYMDWHIYAQKMSPEFFIKDSGAMADHREIRASIQVFTLESPSYHMT
ncbi:hypothetical protein FF38_04819 [Lucilia cuprina]|uniref:Uncharacterized protein n=1 Tax=Lucilia cuprina TaxID=7375 RepID=A0A0L0BKQ5_LUCCU|nr:hypothetical protein FF38_04819 [Lucilia cuprina]